ncbi:hypothetical protein [Yinghuangia soli]|uniref:Peptidase MA-like domain-containing protein n=1 Tax=Yinghuangia soli TaxID=2908204 RepID=A0AA41QAH9_9ACTN|nr:hypothetical protein [Yinghuangia soli]MCF2533736.1 hypothetical protein [Yinghuangia soli]
MAQARPTTRQAAASAGRPGRAGRPGSTRATRLTITLAVLLIVLASVIAYGASLGRPAPAHTPGAAPGSSPAPATAPVSPTVAGLTSADLDSLAAARSRALQNRDEDAFVAALDPETPGLVEEQRRLFRNLRPIPFREASYRVEAVHPAPGNGPPDALYVDVSFLHRIDNADTATVTEGYRWTVTRPRPGAAPRITGITGTPYEGVGYRYARDYPAPWDRSELTVVIRPHVVLLAEQQLAARADTLADAAEQAALADLREYTGARGTAPGFVVVPVADRGAFYDLYGGRADQHGDESGLTYALRTATEPAPAGSPTPKGNARGPQFGGARIVVDVNSGYFTSSDPDRAGALLRHEMAHALITPLRTELAGQNQPVWIVEGFADWLALRSHRGHQAADLTEARAYVRSGRFSGTLPTDADLYQADPVGNAASYELAHLALLRIEQTRGAAAVYRLVADVYADPSPVAVDAAIKQATGMERTEFEADWAQYVRALFGWT